MDAPTLTLKRARRLRRSMTPPELRLWGMLRGKAVGGARFRRQHPIGPYILDFFCPAANLAIEVDGEDHGFEDRARRDARRDRWLAEHGVRTLRIAAGAVRDNADGVLASIIEALGEAGQPAIGI